MEGVVDRITFPGYIADDELPTYYSAADLFVLPSKADRGEAFGIVLLEAMACGTPVVTTDIPGVRTVVGKGGVVVPPGDRAGLLEGIANGIEESFSPRERAVENFSLDEITAQVVSVYDTIITGCTAE